MNILSQNYTGLLSRDADDLNFTSLKSLVSVFVGGGGRPDWSQLGRRTGVGTGWRRRRNRKTGRNNKTGSSGSFSVSPTQLVIPSQRLPAFLLLLVSRRNVSWTVGVVVYRTLVLEPTSAATRVGTNSSDHAGARLHLLLKVWVSRGH